MTPIDCVVNDDLVCERCGRPAPCKAVRRNCRGELERRRPPTGEFLKRYINLLALDKKEGCQKCDEMLDKMNIWGPDGCHAHRSEIVEHLRAAYNGLSLMELAKAMTRCVSSGLAFTLNPLDPIGSLVDKAINESSAIAMPK